MSDLKNGSSDQVTGKYQRIAAMLLLLGTLTSCATIALTEAVTTEPRIVVVRQSLEWAPADTTRDGEVRILLPFEYPGRQRLISEHFSLKPSRVVEEDGNRYALFLSDLLEGRVSITIESRWEISRYDWTIADSTLRTGSPSRHENYLAAEPFLEVDASLLIRQAGKLRGNDPTSTLRNIHRFVTKHMTYSQYEPRDRGALWAFNKKRGDCTEFADLFVTLCRINSIPARLIEGLLLGGSDQRHDWAEAYLDGIGWIPFDPTLTATDSGTSVDRLRNMYIYMSARRSDEFLGGYHYCHWLFRGDPPSVTGWINAELESSGKGIDPAERANL